MSCEAETPVQAGALTRSIPFFSLLVRCLLADCCVVGVAEIGTHGLIESMTHRLPNILRTCGSLWAVLGEARFHGERCGLKRLMQQASTCEYLTEKRPAPCWLLPSDRCNLAHQNIKRLEHSLIGSVGHDGKTLDVRHNGAPTNQSPLQ